MKHRIFFVVAVAFILLSPPGAAAKAEKSNADTYRLLNLFGDVFERVRADYVEKSTMSR